MNKSALQTYSAQLENGCMPYTSRDPQKVSDCSNFQDFSDEERFNELDEINEKVEKVLEENSAVEAVFAAWHQLNPGAKNLNS